MRFTFRLVFSVGLACLASFSRADEVLLKGIKLVDPENQNISDGNLLLRNGKIVSFTRIVPTKFSGKTLDLSGRWVIPGLTDAHTHLEWGNWGSLPQQRMSFEEGAKRMVYCGVTAFLDLFADENEIFRQRRVQRTQGWPGADIYAAGPMLTVTDGHGTEFPDKPRICDTTKQAIQQVTQLAKKKPDVIKIIYDHMHGKKHMSEAVLRTIVSTAKQFHIKTVVHIGSVQDFRDAVEAGATVVTHVPNQELGDDLIKRMKEKGTWEIPTLVYQTELAHLIQDPSFLNSPLLAASADPDLIESYGHLNLSIPFWQQEVTGQKTGLETYYRSVKKMAAAGIKLMAGTDAGGAPSVFQGYSVHREMLFLTEAGLSNWQALAAATSVPRKFLGRPAGIHVGDKADLVVLSGSPIVDIRNTQKIEMVFHQGEAVDREALIPRRTDSSVKGN